MWPISSRLYLRNRRPRNAIFFRKNSGYSIASILESFSYFSYLFFCQLATNVQLSLLRAFFPTIFMASPLFPTIMNVVFIGAKKKMCRICALWIIAFMENAQAFRDFSFVNLPGDTACDFRTISPPRAAPHFALAGFTFAPEPFPASSEISAMLLSGSVLVNFLPESICNWSSFRSCFFHGVTNNETLEVCQ